MPTLPATMRPSWLGPRRAVDADRHRMQADRRGTAAERGYDARWRRERLAYLAAHPLCVCCLANGRTAAAVIVDHVRPHRGDMVLFWERGNWQGLCRRHHDYKAIVETKVARGAMAADMLRLDRPVPDDDMG